MKSNLEDLQEIVQNGGVRTEGSRFLYPPGVAKTLGMKLVEVDKSLAVVEIMADPESHGNPMGTVHGGVLCDMADLAIGTAHATTLNEGESFTSLDLQINFFRPVWKEKLLAKARPVQLGKTVSRYVCDIVREDGKLVAQVTSSVMTLYGQKAQGR